MSQADTFFLKRLKNYVEFSDDIETLNDINSETFIKIICDCLILIDSKYEANLKNLKSNTKSEKIRACHKILPALKSLNFDYQIGYEQILYPTVDTIRDYCNFLIGLLHVEEEHENNIDLFDESFESIMKRKVQEFIEQPLNLLVEPCTPAKTCPSKSVKCDHIVDFKITPKILEIFSEELKVFTDSHTKRKISQKEQLTLDSIMIQNLSTINIDSKFLKEEEPIISAIPGENLEDAQQKQMEDLTEEIENLEKEVINYHRLIEAKKGEIDESLELIHEQAKEIQEKSDEFAQALSVIDLMEDFDKSKSNLANKIDEQTLKLQQINDEFSTLTTPIVTEIDQIEATEFDIKEELEDKSLKIDQLKKSLKRLISDIEAQEKKKEFLLKEFEQADKTLDRSEFVKLVNHLHSLTRKGRAEITKISTESRLLDKDIRAVVMRLEQIKGYLDESLFIEAQNHPKNEIFAQIYKRFVEFSTIVKNFINMLEERTILSTNLRAAETDVFRLSKTIQSLSFDEVKEDLAFLKEQNDEISEKIVVLVENRK
eukprot:TRINITY_DN2973_c0_g2_i1.p1 TRINITY_DN2973_c0_g2~~TRINITY_DN2973_c0_g2_i1.p1  ORF type:complete len:543 (+),score=158.46 TRINITY_DN2973_c0_g2_i1:70-1698(+)